MVIRGYLLGSENRAKCDREKFKKGKMNTNESVLRSGDVY